MVIWYWFIISAIGIVEIVEALTIREERMFVLISFFCLVFRSMASNFYIYMFIIIIYLTFTSLYVILITALSKPSILKVVFAIFFLIRELNPQLRLGWYCC